MSACAKRSIAVISGTASWLHVKIRFARAPSGGLIMPASGAARLYRDLIIALAARHQLPAIDRSYAAVGGLMTYGPDYFDQYRPRRLLCRSHSTRREAGRSPGAVSDQVRDGREQQDRQGARACGAAVDPAARRRGDRVAVKNPPGGAGRVVAVRRARVGEPESVLDYEAP